MLTRAHGKDSRSQRFELRVTPRDPPLSAARGRSVSTDLEDVMEDGVSPLADWDCSGYRDGREAGGREQGVGTWSVDSRVRSKSSTGMPCSERTSWPISGPPRLVTYGTMLGVRQGQRPGRDPPVSRSTFCERFHTRVL